MKKMFYLFRGAAIVWFCAVIVFVYALPLALAVCLILADKVKKRRAPEAVRPLGVKAFRAEETKKVA